MRPGSRRGIAGVAERVYRVCMITGVHTLMYSDDPEATRAFFRDVVGWPYIEWGREAGWLMFSSGPSEQAVHPTRGEGYERPRHTEISFICDDLDATMADLASRGATFAGDPRDEDWGRGVVLDVPGADGVLLYRPSYRPAFESIGE